MPTYHHVGNEGLVQLKIEQVPTKNKGVDGTLVLTKGSDKDAVETTETVQVTIAENGQMTCCDGKYKFGMPQAMKATVEAAKGAPEANLSGAKRRLNRLRRGELKADEKPFEPIQWEGEAVWIKRLAYPDFMRCNLSASRDGAAKLDITNSGDDLRSYTIAIIEACVFADEEGESPFFTMDDAATCVDSSHKDDIEFVRGMLNSSINFNSALLPKELMAQSIPTSKQKENEGSNERSDAPESTQTTSSNSTPSNGTSGSSETDSIEKPAVLLDDLEMATSESTLMAMER